MEAQALHVQQVGYWLDAEVISSTGRGQENRSQHLKESMSGSANSDYGGKCSASFDSVCLGWLVADVTQVPPQMRLTF